MFRGSDRAEDLHVSAASTPRSVDLAGGNDRIFLEDGPETGDVLHGGAGHDYVVAHSTAGRLDLDLAPGALHAVREPVGTPSLRARSFESANLAARTVNLTGTGADYVEAGRGRDRAWGGAGRDTLKGGKGHDQLRGGPGQDLAVGGEGRDLCRAERQRSCES